MFLLKRLFIVAAAFSLQMCNPAFAIQRSCFAHFYLPIPVVAQSWEYTCGAACMDSILRYWHGGSPGEAALAQQMGTFQNRTTWANRIVDTANRYGLFAYYMNGRSLNDLARYLAQGETVYIGVTVNNNDHWMVLAGMTEEHVILMDPWFAGSGQGYRVMTFSEFLVQWYDGGRATGHVVRIHKQPLRN